MPQRSLMIPALPCRSLDETIPFYEALGFKRTYRQDRPNPYAVVERDDIIIHLFGMPAFEPADSYGTVIIQVADPDELYRAFASGLRATYGKVPAAGIPRVLRPRKRQGTVYGFSVVDPGGNWLRFMELGASEDHVEEGEPSKGLALVIDTAARQADAHGDDAAGLDVLTRGLMRHPDAAAITRVRALLYRAELAARVGDAAFARASLADASAIDLGADERALVSEELNHTTQLIADLHASR